MSQGGSGNAGNTPSSNTYFVDKKSEVNELKLLLRSPNVEKDLKKKREVVKKVIAYMTLGYDVSKLFTEMMLVSGTNDIIIKKMTYLYFSNYARSNEELATLCINTMIKDCRDSDPMVRGLALRALSSLRLKSTIEYLIPVLLNSFHDSSSYVRRNAVVAVLKIYHIQQQAVMDSQLIDKVCDLIKDRDAQVVATCLMVLHEIKLKDGGVLGDGASDDDSNGSNNNNGLAKDILSADTTTATHPKIKINIPFSKPQLVIYLLNRIKEFNEWGQSHVLTIIARYRPSNQDETLSIMNVLDGCLRVSNSAVVLAAAKIFLRYAEALPDLKFQIYQRLKQPILTLIATARSELKYSVLAHACLMVSRCPGIFDDEYKQFFCLYNEPFYVKKIKLQILPELADHENVSDIVAELSEYVADIDTNIARLSIRAMGKISVKMPPSADVILNNLLELMEMDASHVRNEVVDVIKNILRRYPDRCNDMMPALPRCIRSVSDAKGKSAVIFIIGEFGDKMKEAPYLLEKHYINPYCEGMSSTGNGTTAAGTEDVTVRLEILVATMKLFFKRAPEVKDMLIRLFKKLLSDVSDTDVHDRALFYFRLLKFDPEEARKIIDSQKPPISKFAEEDTAEIQQRLFEEFNTMAITYNKSSDLFIDEEHREIHVSHDKDKSHFIASSSSNYAPKAQTYTQPSATQNIPSYTNSSSSQAVDDLLGFGFPSATSNQSQSNNNNNHSNRNNSNTASDEWSLKSEPKMDQSQFQSLWTSLKSLTSLQTTVPTSITNGTEAIEQRMKIYNIECMASGNLDRQLKFYFYAVDNKNRTYLSEIVVDKSSGKVDAKIKGDDEELVQNFSAVILSCFD